MTKKLGIFLLALMALVGIVAPSHAEGGADNLWNGELDRIRRSDVVYSSNSVSMHVWYVGDSSEAYLSIFDTNIVAFAPNGIRDTDGFGGNGNAQYDLSASTTNTIGELCSVIDNLADYECELVGAKSDDNANLLGNQVSTPTLSGGDLKVPGGYKVKFDGAAGDATLNGAPLFHAIGYQPGPNAFVRLLDCAWNSNGVRGLFVYGKKRRDLKFDREGDDDDTDLAVRMRSIDDVDMWTNFEYSIQVGSNTSHPEGGLEFANGAHVVVRNSDVGPAQNGNEFLANPNFLGCRAEIVAR